MVTEGTIERLFSLARNLPIEIGNLNEGLEEKDRRQGGYLCAHLLKDIEDLENYHPFMIMRIGDPPQSKWHKSLTLAQEKAYRLSSLPTHLSSWQSRNLEKEKYGGAIRIPSKSWREGLILSFSGLIEIADEAALVNLALTLRLIEKEEAQAIKDLSKNPLISLKETTIFHPPQGSLPGNTRGIH